MEVLTSVSKEPLTSLMMKAVGSSETSVNISNITRRINPEDQLIFVGFWRWCISIERIVLLDFIHRLVSQEQTKLRN
jgi:hypothetical protein